VARTLMHPDAAAALGSPTRYVICSKLFSIPGGLCWF
jgi:hypothetical protein